MKYFKDLLINYKYFFILNLQNKVFECFKKVCSVFIFNPVNLCD